MTDRAEIEGSLGVPAKQLPASNFEAEAIRAFQLDQPFLQMLQVRGMPWRGVQEHLKELLPRDLSDRDRVAYKLVPKAMEAVFGRQNSEWRTEKRPSKSSRGATTWIVVPKSGH